MLPYEHCSMEDVFPHNKTQIKQIKTKIQLVECLVFSALVLIPLSLQFI